MKYVMLVSMFLGIMLMFWNCSNDSHDSEIQPPAQQGTPELTIAVQKIEPSIKTILIQLTVKNIGEHRLILPRLEEDQLKQYLVWGGYLLSISNQDKQGFGYAWLRPPAFSKKELIELHPGEHFSVTINIADARYCIEPPSKDTKGQYLELASTDGAYTVKARLDLADDNIPTDLRGLVWKGKKESNTITFVVETGKQQDQASQERKQDTQQ
jgi:hypothetical protein